MVNKKIKVKELFDPGTLYEMEKRVDNFKKAMKNPTKSLTPDPDVKHDVHNVDTQGFNPSVKITVDDEDVET